VLLDRGELVQVSPEVLFLRATYEEMVEAVKTRLASGGSLTVAQVRDMFNNSRKYALALMEHLDASGVTKRVGDERVLK
jgi:selenocysteine-specific elongation factor